MKPDCNIPCCTKHACLSVVLRLLETVAAATPPPAAAFSQPTISFTFLWKRKRIFLDPNSDLNLAGTKNHVLTKFWKFSFIHFGQSFKSNYKWAIRGLFFFNLQTTLYRLQLITLSEKFFGLNMAATRPQSNQISTVTYFYVHNRCMDFLLLF